MTTALIFACHGRACAPPPVGVGGSKASSTDAVTRAFEQMKRNRPGRGADANPESDAPAEIKLKSIPNLPTERLQRAMAHYHGQAHTPEGLHKWEDTRRALAETGSKIKAIAHELMLRGEEPSGCKFCKPNERHPVITADEARGDSKPVSRAEFLRLAAEGQTKLDGFKERSSAIKGLDDNWGKVKADSYLEATQSWGGATIDAHTGRALSQGANKWALTVKDKGFETVSVPEDASKADFDAAMDQAKEKFRHILEREDHHLGVFHDDDLGRIDIDPVLVVSKLEDVHTIGAATRAIGGAYNFADGNGYWPPHVREGE